MAGPITDSPFNDAIGPDSVPKRGSGRGSYDSAEIPGGPKRDGGMLPELHRDEHFGSPKLSGPITHSPFKDAVD